ncbi:Sulfhydryl oxidase [Aphelenchoides besseyi]|nr:Sulfhydryl oxidase [Aphelenchoides besseyi]KAI6231912.1 Sulfhydryl oxidase [Aphelenchoides besseyi]
MEYLNGRPCKACVSVEDMMRMSREAVKKKKSQTADGNIKPTASEQSTSDGRRRSDCPVDKDELGRSTWNLLHTMAAYYPEKPTNEEQQSMKQTVESLSKTYPCPHCAEDFRKDLVENPIELKDRNVLSKWMCEMHNRVNVKLGKETFDCSKVMERWYDGWKDGSCDY